VNAPGLDKYATDARTWRDFATLDYLAAKALFGSRNPFLYLAAATLGHHSLEMYLKAALICEGMTVIHPRKIKSLDPAVGLTAANCVWGHSLVHLAEKLSKRRPDFDLSAQMNIAGCVTLRMPMRMRDALAMFDPFSSELRYPQELKTLEGVGEEEELVLDQLVARLKPFCEDDLSHFRA
jgi:hypothetical protein